MSQKKNDALSKELVAKHDELEVQRKEREGKEVRIILKGILDNVHDMSATFTKLVSKFKEKAAKAIKLAAVGEFGRAAHSVLWNQDFSYRTNAEQDIYCYTGTHWVLVPPATWKDFILKCAVKCGLDQDCTMEPDYMKKLTNATALSFFKDIDTTRPKDELWLNMSNETLVISSDGTVTQHAHRPEDVFYYCLPYNYNPQSQCPLWQAFLDRVLPEYEAQRLLAEFICTILLRTHRFEKMLWLYGPGQNGKSTVLNVLESLLGSANISCISLSLLTKDHKIRLGIEHKMVNISSESGRDIDPNVLKQLCSGEKVPVERKYHDARTTDDYGLFMVATNKMPQPEDTEAFRRRLIIMPFEVSIPDSEKDVHLTEKLRTELPGILNWALAAMPDLLRRDSYIDSPLCNETLRKYMAQTDSVRLFVHEMCEKSDQPLQGAYLYSHYQNYCQFMRLDDKVGRNAFYKRLSVMGYKPFASGNNAKSFYLKVTE